jgi:hypothetical protein
VSNNPMFYNTVVALNRDVHREFRIDDSAHPYAFASASHVIPAVVDEFAAAARHVPILFVPGTPAPSAVFLVGVRPGHNDLVDPEGNWRAGYVPAFLRRYPFMLGETPQGGALACIDDRYVAFNKASGQPLFREDGSDSPFLQQKIQLINDYFAAAKRTDVFMRSLQDLQLLRTVTIEARAPEGVSSAMHGLLVVNEARLNELPADDFMDLRRQGFLAAIYAHLLSLKSIDSLRDAAFGAASDPSGAEARPSGSALQ